MLGVVQLVSDCHGDFWGLSESRGEPWTLIIETGARSGGTGPNIPELTVSCVKNLPALREAILQVKRGDSPLEDAPPTAESGPSKSDRDVLLRIERLLGEAVRRLGEPESDNEEEAEEPEGQVRYRGRAASSSKARRDR